MFYFGVYQAVPETFLMSSIRESLIQGFQSEVVLPSLAN